MSYQPTPPPPPPAPAGNTITVGPALTLLGVGLAGTSLFGLPLVSEKTFDYTDYTLLHSVADLVREGRGRDLFDGFQFWWTWGRLTFAAVVLVLAAVLVAGVARRVLGVVVAALALVFGIVELIALAKTPTYRSIQQFRDDGETVLGNASYGIWLGLVGLVLLIAGALLVAVQSRRRGPAGAAYPPSYPAPSAQAYGAAYPPPSDPTAQRL